MYSFIQCMDLIKLTAGRLGKACRKQGDGRGNLAKVAAAAGKSNEEKERFGLSVCAAYKSLCCVSALLDHNSMIKA